MIRQHTDTGNLLLKPRFVALALLLLFLVVSSLTVLVINRQYSDLKQQASVSDSTVASLLSEFVLEHENAVIGVLQSYASRPLLIDAVKRKDMGKTLGHLEGMKQINEGLDLTFITDKKGILWMNYPVFRESVGRDFSDRDWYKGVSSGWKPYISNIFKLIVADQPLAVTACVPIFDGKGSVIGILANSQRVSFLAETIHRVPLQSYTKVTLLDRTGNIIYSNRLGYAAEITMYPFLSAVKEALQAGKSRIEIGESQRGAGTISATVRPIAPIAWTVVAEHTSKDVLRTGYSQFLTTVAMSFLFFTAISLLLLYARKQALLAHTERLLMAERKTSEEERQRQMQEKLMHSEMKYVRLHEGMIDGFVATGMDGYIRESNQAYRQMLAYGPDELMSLTYKDITPAQWHDFEKTIVKEQVIPRGHSEIYEKEYIRKDGTVFPVELRTYLIRDDKGSPREMWAIVRDITVRKAAEDKIRTLNQELEQRVIERTAQLDTLNKELSNEIEERKRADKALRESEERFRAAAEGSLDAFFIFRSARNNAGQITDFEFVYLNTPAEKMVGMSREKAIGQRLCELIPINRTGGFFDKYVEVVETGKTLDEEFPIAAGQIHVSWLHHQVVSLGDGIAIMSRDITERKRAEEEIETLNRDIRQRAAQLEAANKELEAFSYSVSHDLRAPLRTINGFSQALLEDYGDKIDEEGKAHLVRLRKGSQKMGRLIDDLLNLSRVSRADVRYDRVDLTALVRGIADELIATNPERHVDVTIQDSLAAEADRHLLRIVMTNLLDNAYKFTRNITRAQIEFGMITREGGPVYFVRDNGAGFDMQYADRLFGAFQRLHAEIEFEGTGIGLATVQRIIHKHGGIVWGEGKVNDGASFFFTLSGGGN